MDGEFIANPTVAQRAECDLDVDRRGSRDAIVMVEGGAKEVSEEVMVDALLFGQAAVQQLLDAQDALRQATGNKPKRAFEPPKNDVELKAKVKALAWEKVKEAYGRHEKHDRYGRLSEIKKELLQALKEEAAGDAQKLANVSLREKEIKGDYEDVKYEYMRKMITDEGRRIDGRGTAEIRQITCEVGLLPRVHGSALFTRGETQALVAATLGTSEDEQSVEMLHGHALQEVHAPLQLPAVLGRRGEAPPRPGPARDRPRRPRRARAPPGAARRGQVPLHDPRSSPTSSSRTARRRWPRSAAARSRSWTRACRSRRRSRASRWASSRRASKVAILSDILGDEDHLGDMDFKVCGTADGHHGDPDGHQDRAA